MKITQLTVKRPVTTIMFFLGIVLLGFVSLRELSVDLLPNISYPRLSVVTQYQGVAPEEIETLITTPLEAAVSRIPGLRLVESVSKEGVSFMTLEFSWGTDMDFAMLHTREKLDGAQSMLPEDVEEPTIIPLDPQSRVSQISNRIQAFNRNIQGGSVRKGRFKYALRVVGEFEQVDEIGEISLKTTKERGVIKLKDVAIINDSIKEREGLTRLNGSESIGILVRKESGANTVEVTQLAREVMEEIEQENTQIDILIVSEQAKYIENAISSVLNAIIFGGILAFFVLIIFLQDFKTPSIIAVVIPISIIATFNLLYFRDITLNIMSLGGLALGCGMLVDNSIVVSESIFRHRSLGKSLFEAALSGTKEVGMAVTASTLTTISVFLPIIYVHGVAGQLFKDQALTVTFALLSSLIVSLTLLPMLASRRLAIEKDKKGAEDSAEIEHLDEHPKKSKWHFLGLPYKGLRRLVYFLFKVVYWVLNFLFSFIVQAVLLIVHYIAIPFRPVVRAIFKAYNAFYQRFALVYHQFLLWSLDNKGKVLLGSLFFLSLTLFVATKIPRELMPKPETVSFEANLKTPIDFSFEQTADVVASLEQALGQKKSVVDYFSQVGIVSGLESQNPDISVNSGRIYVEVDQSSAVDETIEYLRERMDKFPGLTYSIIKEQSTMAQFLAFATAEIGLKIKGEDLNKLNGLALELVEKLNGIQGIADISTNIGEGKPEFLIKIRKGALEKYDISAATIGSYFTDAVRGRRDTQFKEMEKKYDILVRLTEDVRDNIEFLLNEQINHQGNLIPLRELVYYELARGPKEIRRENQQREVLVTANLRGTKISQVAPQIREKIDELELPPNYRVVFSGEQEEMAKSFRSLIFAFSLAVLLVYMIMAAQFESLLHPFLILFTLPMGLTGAIWALYITGQTLNVISVMGMVVLAGIVVNDAIVKIDYTNQLRKKGMALREAIMEASKVRLRPILMTTVTTAFGLFPMSLGLGKGAELQQPLAISVIGGLMLATFLTLILIPLSYDLAEKRKAEKNKS